MKTLLILMLLTVPAHAWDRWNSGHHWSQHQGHHWRYSVPRPFLDEVDRQRYLLQRHYDQYDRWTYPRAGIVRAPRQTCYRVNYSVTVCVTQ